MKALVTGGGGFLGLAIVRRLLASGLVVRSFSRQNHPALRELGVEQHLGDLADPIAVARAVARCQVVFHVAAKPGIWGPYAEYHRVNVTGTENVLAACRQHAVARLIYTSSPSVVFDGRDMEGVDESAPYPSHFEAHYPHTKALAEQQVLRANDSHLATVALRPHLIWGPGDNHLLPRLAARARAGQLRRIGRQRKLIDTLHVDNAAEAHWLAAERLTPGSPLAGRAYFISQGEPREIWEMINALLAAAGTPPVQRSIPKPLALLLAWGCETVHRVTRNPNEPRLTRFVVQELCTAHWFDIGAARRDLGYQPGVTIAEGLRRLAAEFGQDARHRA
jgi:nucleoside-diphosphate-sugar epimerase